MSGGKSVLIIGGGGHARVVYRLCQELGWNVIGFVAENCQDYCREKKVFQRDDDVLQISSNEIVLANGIGDIQIRKRVFNRFVTEGYSFPALVHPKSIVASDVRLSSGAQVMAGVVVQAGASVGENVILNTSSSIDHDSIVGNHSHVAPGAVLCGGVIVGEECFVGARSVLVPNVRIANGSFVGAGSVVTRSFEAPSKLLGNPARAVQL
jgi:sugar O-acyltransferase (sialic acid O-acetyltransferase NeuD family)